MKKTNKEIWSDAPTVSVGIDIGSTTAKLVVFSDGEIVYQRYERGERELPLWAAIKLANYYGVTLDYLVGRE